jgi:CHAT domain-containing protein/Tfp pilus assembly protein PilF
MKHLPDGRAGIPSAICLRYLPLALIASGFILTNLPGQTDRTLDHGAKVLEPEKALQATLAGGQSHAYQFYLRAGEYARVVVEQRSVDLMVACFGPAGQEIFSADSSVIGDAETVEVIADVPGAYRLRITASESHAPSGRYEIALREIRPSTNRHRMRIAAARAFAAGMNSRKSDKREGFLQAISQVKQALGHWRAAEDRIEEATSLFTIGLLYIETADRQNALQYTTEAFAVAQSTTDQKIIGRALEAIGRVHNNFGDKRNAIEYCERALPLLRAVADRAGEANALDNAGVAYSGAGDKRKALVYFDQAVQIFRELQDRRLLAELAGNIGVAYDNLGEYERALESHESELVLARELADRSTEAVTLNNIASAYTGLGEFQKALDAYIAALEINRSLDNQWNVSINLNNIAWVYGQLGDRQHALNFYQRSLELIRKVNDQRRMAATLNNIASIYAELGDVRNAIEIHNEALTLRHAAGDADGEANSLNSLGSSYAKLGQREKARDFIERALAMHRNFGNRYMLARTLRGVGVFDREGGDPERARSSLEEALQISRAIRDRKGEAEMLAELAKVERDLGNPARVQERAAQALTKLESIRLTVMSPSLRASFLASVRDLQELQIETLMRLHVQQPEKGFGAAALLASERGRARSLLEMLGESGAEIRRGVDAALLTRERELGRLISAKAELQTRLLSGKHTENAAATAERELDALTVELEQVQSRIREASPQYVALTQPVPLDLSEIQTKVLDDNTVLLEYSLGAVRSFLWAVTPSSMDAFELPAKGVIESAAKRVYGLLTARNQRPAGETPAARLARIRQADEAYFEAAQEASRMLLSPAVARIRNKRLLIVGESVLQYLPFGALPEPGTDTPLIASHEIVTAPSASVVAILRQETAGRRPAAKALAVFADPVFHADDARIAPPDKTSVRSGSDLSMQDFARLRFSRAEADEITRLAGSGATLKALDFDASRETAMKPDLGDYRIVHFATHSLLNNEHPELSGVVLSLVDRRGRPQNGFLRLYDVYNLRLGADLVVLSACRTALGEEIKGEGLIGLSRGFLYAGAPRVVATLWEVDDRTTAEAMKKFYEGMLGRAERPAEALRSAQLALWKSRGWEAPYYWAAFTLEGEWH